jgi:hypothetical protein
MSVEQFVGFRAKKMTRDVWCCAAGKNGVMVGERREPKLQKRQIGVMAGCGEASPTQSQPQLANQQWLLSLIVQLRSSFSNSRICFLIKLNVIYLDNIFELFTILILDK